jgi:MscS family membrane protein
MDISKIKQMFEQFAQTSHAFLNFEVFGIAVHYILIGAGLASILAVLPVIVARLASKGLRGATSNQQDRPDAKFSKALMPPAYAATVTAVLFVGLQYLELDGDLKWFARNLLRSMGAATVFWTMYRLVKPFSFAFDSLRGRLSGPLVDWIIKALRIAILFGAITSILEIWGVNVAAVLAGLGLVGVAVALGAQDMFKNLIAGVLILCEQRFENGDWVEVPGLVEGTVEEIGFRSTCIRRFDLSPVYVPNAKLSENVLTNYSRMTDRRIYWTISVEYRSTIDQLRAIRDGIEAYILENEEFVQPSQGTALVRINSFSDSAIDILVYVFTRTTDWGEWLEIKERLAYEIKDIVERSGANFAFPSRSIYVEQTGKSDSEEDVSDEDTEEKDGPDAFAPPSSDRKSQRDARDKAGSKTRKPVHDKDREASDAIDDNSDEDA